MSEMQANIQQWMDEGKSAAEIAELMAVAQGNAPDSPMGWQEAQTSTVAEELENVLLAIRPGRVVKEDGQFGIRNVTLAEVWTLDNGEVAMYGDEVPVRWQVVQRQLQRATAEAPWIVGTLIKSGRAYLLQPPTPGERAEIAEAITVIDAMRLTSEETEAF